MQYNIRLSKEDVSYSEFSKLSFEEYLGREIKEVQKLYFSDNLKELKKYIQGLN